MPTASSSTEMARKPSSHVTSGGVTSPKSRKSADHGATTRGYTDEERKKDSAASSHNEVRDNNAEDDISSLAPETGLSSPTPQLKLRERIEKFEAVTRGSVSPPLPGGIFANTNFMSSFVGNSGGNDRYKQQWKTLSKDSAADTDESTGKQEQQLKYQDQATSMTAKRPTTRRNMRGSGNDSPPQIAANILKSSLRGLLKLQGFVAGTTRLYVNGDLEARSAGSDGLERGGRRHKQRRCRNAGNGCSCCASARPNGSHHAQIMRPNSSKSRVRIVEPSSISKIVESRSI